MLHQDEPVERKRYPGGKHSLPAAARTRLAANSPRVAQHWSCRPCVHTTMTMHPYRLGHHHRFGYFSKTGLPWKAIFDIAVNPDIPSFLEDAAAGTLRQVSWIDPAFTNFNPLGFPVNDDHPPADIKDGQDLVLAVYDALAASPQWDRSLLVIVYDDYAEDGVKPRNLRMACSGGAC